MKRSPRIPLSWYTPKGAIIGAALAVGGGWLVGRGGGVLGLLMFSPILAAAAALPVVVFLAWITGRGQRAYRFGAGRQDQWGYLGHNIRGIVENEKIWLSLKDCEAASGLDLSRGLSAVPPSRRRTDDVKGLMLDMAGMIQVLDTCRDDFTRVSRFRVFLERAVWQTRRG